MPPEQCPACGRFLSAAFVEQASQAPLPCPRCGAAVHLGAAPAPPEVSAAADVDVTEVTTSDDAAVTAAVVASPDEQAPTATAHPLDDWDRTDRAAPTTTSPAMPAAMTPEELGVIAGIVLLATMLAGRGRRVLGLVVGALVAGATTVGRRRA